MKIRKILLPIICIILIISSLTFASDKDIVRFQGVVMGISFNKNLMLVNESRYAWDQNTLFFDDKEKIIPVEKIKVQSYVYIVGETDRVNKRVLIKKIYLLPKFINAKEIHLYPFMQ